MKVEAMRIIRWFRMKRIATHLVAFLLGAGAVYALFGQLAGRRLVVRPLPGWDTGVELALTLAIAMAAIAAWYYARKSYDATVAAQRPYVTITGGTLITRTGRHLERTAYGDRYEMTQGASVSVKNTGPAPAVNLDVRILGEMKGGLPKGSWDEWRPVPRCSVENEGRHTLAQNQEMVVFAAFDKEHFEKMRGGAMELRLTVKVRYSGLRQRPFTYTEVLHYAHHENEFIAIGESVFT